MSNTARTDTRLKKDKLKKKSDENTRLSPTQSDLEEKVTFKVINGEDIQSLAIKEDDLKKLVQPKEPKAEKVQEITVKRQNKEYQPKIELKVAKLVPNSTTKPVDVSDHLGLGFDKYGSVVPHSILGTVEDYLQECVSNGQSIQLPYEIVDTDKLNVGNFDKKRLNQNKSIVASGFGGENALKNWESKSNEQKRTQYLISKTINRPTKSLLINSSEHAYQQTHVKTLLDRTLPLVEKGKGFRFGSEFWNQPMPIGNPDNSIFTTLTKSEKGILPDIELIGKPKSFSHETVFDDNQPPLVNYPWDQSQYLQKRLTELKPFIEEIVPNRPQFSRLEVIGSNVFARHGQRRENEDQKPSKEFFINASATILNEKSILNEDESEHNNAQDQTELDETDLLSTMPDVVQPPIFGPSILFGGQPARWTSNDNENEGMCALESRLNFETKAEKRVLATFEVVNIGTTSIYFDWKKIDDPNPFKDSSRDKPKFYFDTRSSVILPGSILKLYIIFKSDTGGIFTEKWEFLTNPQMLGGASLILTLRGVAIQEDKFKKNRGIVERNLFKREAEIIANSMIELILSGVRTPERPSSPQNAFMTEEDIFAEKNPSFFYDHSCILEIKKIYSDLYNPDSENNLAQLVQPWNLSVNDLKQEILNLDEDSKRQNLLAQLNAVLAKMSFKSYVPNDSKLYAICYNFLCKTVDEINIQLIALKASLNLPVASFDDAYPNIDEFNKNYESWKKEYELMKQIETEKKNRLEKGGKDKGKKADKKDDKKKDQADKKKATPVPPQNKSRLSRGEGSRSASRNREKSDENRVKTPIVYTEEQLQNKVLFEEKAYINIYQMLSKMIDELENNLHGLVNQEDLNRRMHESVNTVRLVSNYSDYID